MRAQPNFFARSQTTRSPRGWRRRGWWGRHSASQLLRTTHSSHFHSDFSDQGSSRSVIVRAFRVASVCFTTALGKWNQLPPIRRNFFSLFFCPIKTRIFFFLSSLNKCLGDILFAICLVFSAFFLIGHFIRVLFSIRISTIKVPAAASEKQSGLKRWKKNYASCCCAFCWAAEPHPTLPPW